jgi:hypothetical protein
MLRKWLAAGWKIKIQIPAEGCSTGLAVGSPDVIPIQQIEV